MGFATTGSQKGAYAALTPIEKDYYNILNVPTTSTPEQIKDAYRKLAKKYHPDVRTASTVEQHEPDVDKFRDVAEAYSVLSVRESRVTYDLTRKKNPDAYKPVSQQEFEMESRRELRNKMGVTPKDKPLRGTYAEDRLNQLKKDREKYNVNYLGFY